MNLKALTLVVAGFIVAAFAFTGPTASAQPMHSMMHHGMKHRHHHHHHHHHMMNGSH